MLTLTLASYMVSWNELMSPSLFHWWCLLG